MNPEERPLIIGSCGGSGSRVVARIARKAGYFMGTNTNKSDDALDFVGFYDHWVNIYLRNTQLSLSQDQLSRMYNDFRLCVKKHRNSISAKESFWGWKNPRSIYLLPFFHSVYPEMKFLHVIRDGRDMAFSKNQNQLHKHGKVILNNHEKKYPLPVKSIILWSYVNNKATNYGEEKMNNNYMRIHFEDLCSDSENVIKRIFDFLGSSNDHLEDVINNIRVPKTIGRWEKQNIKILSRLHVIGECSLKRFGYWDTEFIKKHDLKIS